MKKTLILSLLGLLFSGSLSAGDDELELKWRLSKGDRFAFKLRSVIDSGGRREAKLDGEITITESAIKKSRAKGILVFTKLYAIRALSGSGARADESKLRDQKVKCSFDRNGRIYVDTGDLSRLEDYLEDFLEDIDLKTHFKNLFFELPEKAVSVGQRWKKFQDNSTYELKLDKVETKDGERLALISGSPQSPNKSEVIKGSIRITFDLKHGLIRELKQSHKSTKTMGEIIKSTTTTEVQREFTVSRIVETSPGRCPKCSTQFKSGQFCPKCGEKLAPPKKTQSCPKCQKHYSKGVQFCPEDGSKLELIKEAPIKKKPSCAKCGKTFSGDKKFCPFDGSKLGS